ncbi:MAG: PEP-CTERM sorting domain-containing protein [Gemmatimonadaceae bacterium]
MNMFQRISPIVLALVIAVPASAQITTYSTRAGFVGVAGPITTETFQSCGTTTTTLGTNTTLSATNLGPCSSINSNMTFRPQAEGELYIAGPNQSSNITTALGVNGPAGGYNEVAFGSSMKAFGADLFQNIGGGFQFEVGQPFLAVILGAGNAVVGSFSFNIAATTGGFFGFTSVQNVTAVRISQTTGYGVMDNVSIGAASTSTVPEPSIWALMTAGLCAVGVVARRRRSA